MISILTAATAAHAPTLKNEMEVLASKPVGSGSAMRSSVGSTKANRQGSIFAKYVESQPRARVVARRLDAHPRSFLTLFSNFPNDNLRDEKQPNRAGVEE